MKRLKLFLEEYDQIMNITKTHDRHAYGLLSIARRELEKERDNITYLSEEISNLKKIKAEEGYMMSSVTSRYINKEIKDKNIDIENCMYIIEDKIREMEEIEANSR